MFVFLAYGSTATVARLVGANREKDAAESGVQAMWLALVLGAAVGVVSWGFAPQLAACALLASPVLAHQPRDPVYKPGTVRQGTPYGVSSCHAGIVRFPATARRLIRHLRRIPTRKLPGFFRYSGSRRCLQFGG